MTLSLNVTGRHKKKKTLAW